MTKAKAVALAESDEEAVETSLPRSFADGSETISGYFLWKQCRSKGSRGTRFPLAELRGGSLLSGCWGEASGCAGRGQGPAQLSVGNRHLVLGITCRQTSLFPWVQEAGATHDFQERSSCL